MRTRPSCGRRFSAMSIFPMTLTRETIEACRPTGGFIRSRNSPSMRYRMRVPFLSGSMWMSLAPSLIAVSSAILTRLTIGLPSTILSRLVAGPSSTVSLSTTCTSESARDARNESTSVLPPAYFLMNSSMFPAGAKTGRIRQPVSCSRRSIFGRDCGSLIATVSTSWTLNIGMATSRSASSSPINFSSDGSISPWRSWQLGMPRFSPSTRSNCALVTMPRSMSISPSFWPVAFCSARARSNCSWEMTPWATRVSPSLSFLSGPLTGSS